MLVVTYSGRGECFYPLSEQVKVVYLADRVGSCHKSFFNQFARLWALRGLIRETKPGVAISFLTNVNVAVILATRGLGVPVIACERSNPMVEDKAPRSLKWQRQLLYPLAEMVTVQTEAVVRALASRWRWNRRLRVIPNPLPEDIPAPFSGTKPRGAGRRRLLAMGRLSSEKQFNLLIRAFSDLVSAFPDWDLWILGEGPLRPALESQVARVGLAGRVFLPGTTTKPWEEMLQADAFALSSRYEGFPNVLLEAMALGLPCVTFDCPSGPREISREGQDAVLVPAGDEAGMRETLARVMGDEGLRRELGSRASASVRERYSLDRILAQWDDLFAEVGERR